MKINLEQRVSSIVTFSKFKNFFNSIGKQTALTIAIGIGSLFVAPQLSFAQIVATGRVHPAADGFKSYFGKVRGFNKRTNEMSNWRIIGTVPFYNDSCYYQLNVSDFPSQDVQNGDSISLFFQKDTIIGGDTLKYGAKTLKIFDGTETKPSVPDIFLNIPNNNQKAFAVDMLTIKDTSQIVSEIRAIYWLKKNEAQKCTTFADTTTGDPQNPGRGFFCDFYGNLEMQDSTFSQGDSFKIRLEKTRNDTTWFTEIASAIDTTYWDAMLVNANNSVHNGAFHGDTLYFPQGFSVFKDIGLEQILVPDSADSGQMIVPGIIIRNYGGIVRQPWLHCKINEFYNDSMQVTMPPGIDTFYFAPCSLNSVGNFLVTQYSVLQGDVNPSNDTLRKTIVVNPVGIVEEKLENRVRGLIIKPNPARNYLISTKEAILYDALGRKIKKIDKGKNSINLNSGVYFVKKDEDIEKLVIYK
ncbi:MAG: T9SS type A sorting domain-containing protein [Candidatus Pacearchaeota archaeon]